METENLQSWRCSVITREKARAALAPNSSLEHKKTNLFYKFWNMEKNTGTYRYVLIFHGPFPNSVSFDDQYQQKQ